MRIGVVGYGTGGRHFHVPFILAARGCELAGVVARAPATVARVKADLPDTPIFPSLSAMLDAGVDAVTITTPPETRAALVLEAIAAGVHVMADKPFAPSAEAARDLDRAAKAKGVTLGVYHNRRWDADIQTLKKLMGDDRLGQVWRLHNRMDFDDPATLEHGPTGGLLRDLGTHLVDQMIYLLGPVRTVYAHLDSVDMPEGPTNASFTLTLGHEGGTRSHVSASKLNRFSQRELRAYGSAGSYVSHATDVQAQDIFAGRRPADAPASWGFEPEAAWGTLRTAAGAERVPAEQGAHHACYAAFVEAVTTGAPPPVTAEMGIATLAVLDAAQESAAEQRVVRLS